MVENTDIIKRLDQQASDRKIVESMWDAITKFILPYRGKFFEKGSDEGSIDWFRHRDVYDSTAIMAHQNLSASLHGALSSPSIRWFEMRYRNQKLNKNKPALNWLQDSAEAVHHALQDSNFNLEINETYQDVCGFGTAFITLEESAGAANEWNGLQFSSVPLKEGYFEQDHKGQCLRFYRQLRWTPQQIIRKFGEKVPEAIKELDRAGNTTKQDVIFCVYPRNNKIIAIGEKVAPSRRPWEYRYVLRKGAETLGTPGGYYEMPVFVPRWRKTSESMWGNSPAMIALADTLTLNDARKMQLVASEKMIDPAMIAEERALITDLNLGPGKLTVVRSIDGIKPLETRGNINVSDMMIDQLQAAIRNYFFVDQLSFPNPQAQPMTATEAQIRYEQMQRLLGPTLGRLQSDLLDPIVSRTFRMLARDGAIDPPPEIVIEMNAEFDIEYMGSLVRSQRIDNAASIERLVGSVGAMAQVFPEMIDAIDPVEVVHHLGRDLNVPALIVRSADEIKKLKQERDEQQDQMQQAMMAEQEGKALKAAGEGQRAIQEVDGGVA